MYTQDFNFVYTEQESFIWVIKAESSSAFMKADRASLVGSGREQAMQHKHPGVKCLCILRLPLVQANPK